MQKPSRTPPSPQRPLRADAQRNYERLLAKAHEAFAEFGINASLDEIAKRAGVGVGTLYRHFPTREALLSAVLEERLQGLGEKGHQLLESPSSGEALATWLKALIRHATTYRGLASTLSAVLQGVTEACDQMHEAGAKLLARAQDSGELRKDVSFADAVSMATAIAFVAEQNPADPTCSERLLALFLDGLRAPKRKAR